MFDIKIPLSGAWVSPVIEGGKGMGISDGLTAGSFAAEGAVGTFSGVNARFMDDNGNYVPIVYHKKNRLERHFELVDYSIKAAVSQAKRAWDVSGGKGRIHMNLLWEAGGIPKIMEEILSKTRGMIHGVVCGAGMPYRLAEITSKYDVYYHPIVSSARAFAVLWKRSYHRFRDFFGSVVYEDPWVAGGHNGISNKEDPSSPEDPYQRVVAIRRFMKEVGLDEHPIVMAGGVWHLDDWKGWFNNEEIGPVGFQLGTRPLLTKESPISAEWKKKLMTLEEGDVILNTYSPTGLHSSAVNNNFLQELRSRSEFQIPFSPSQSEEFNAEHLIGPRKRKIYIKSSDKAKADAWESMGYDHPMSTPDSTLIFVTADKSREIHADQEGCMGCLSHCRFSNWSDRGDHNTGYKTDPRSFCINKTLQAVIWGGDAENDLVFAGHNVYKFSQDPFYRENPVPTIKQLVAQILTGK